MTTVAYRDGVMAADSQADSGGLLRIRQKLHRVGEEIIGSSGNSMDIMAFVKWWRSGNDLMALPEFRSYGRDSDPPDFVALVLSAAGLELWNEYFEPLPILDEFFAIGSGAAAAIAAMHMGADAPKAVEIAALVDVATGGEVQVEALDGEPGPAHKVLRDPAWSKKAMIAAGLALTQRPRNGGIRE